MFAAVESVKGAASTGAPAALSRSPRTSDCHPCAAPTPGPSNNASVAPPPATSAVGCSESVDSRVPDVGGLMGDDAKDPKRLKTIRGSGYVLVKEPG